MAWLSYDYAAQNVWLDDSEQADGDAWGLCPAHALRLKVPQGWTTVDRRQGREDWPSPARLAV